MKKNLFYLSLTLAFCVNCFSAFSKEANNITLTGSIVKGIARSLSTVAPIESYVTDFGINTYFNKSLGYVAITVCNESGTIICQTVIDSYVVNTAFISMETYPSGFYTIKFVCDYGMKIGEFYWNE